MSDPEAEMSPSGEVEDIPPLDVWLVIYEEGDDDTLLSSEVLFAAWSEERARELAEEWILEGGKIAEIVDEGWFIGPDEGFLFIEPLEVID